MCIEATPCLISLTQMEQPDCFPSFSIDVNADSEVPIGTQ